MLRNSMQAWGAIAKTLHWSMLALFLVQIPLGWAAVSWRLSPLKIDLFVWHKSTGILLLALATIRIAWRLANPPPPSVDGLPRWEQRAGAASHAALYVLIVSIPMSGWVINSAANIPLNVFWLFPLPDITAPDKALADIAARVHFGLYVALSVLVCLHIGAALRHHFVRRNNILVRMLPGRWS